ncbi:MAG: cytidine deaminase [Clostridia bacterium]|jgi:dCMP deaminase|nr:cytidine deaminase [Clostridia bacterium]
MPEIEFLEHNKRKSWDAYFLDISRLVSSRSTCLRRKVGAVLVKDNHILTTGYNGAPRGLEHCLDRGCIREQKGIPSGERHEFCRGIHAEQNALIQAAVHGVSIEGSTLYCTNFPCALCSKLIINAKVKKIVYVEGYPDDLAKELLAESDVELLQLGESDEI